MSAGFIRGTRIDNAPAEVVARTRARRRLYRRMRRAIEILSRHRSAEADRIAEKLARAQGLEEIQEVRRRDLEPVLDELNLQVAPELDGTDVQIGERRGDHG